MLKALQATINQLRIRGFLRRKHLQKSFTETHKASSPSEVEREQ